MINTWFNVSINGPCVMTLFCKCMAPIFGKTSNESVPILIHTVSCCCQRMFYRYMFIPVGTMFIQFEYLDKLNGKPHQSNLIIFNAFWEKEKDVEKKINFVYIWLITMYLSQWLHEGTISFCLLNTTQYFTVSEWVLPVWLLS